MKNCLIQLAAALLFNFIITTSLYAADWALSFGANDIIIKGARPLEDAPNGGTSHTPGIQLGIFGESSFESTIKQQGYFKVFIDWNKDKLDPDYIPIWFMGNYHAKARLASFSNNTSLNMLLDADFKMNSVSSIELISKLFPGVSADYDNEILAASLKISAGRYAFEMDDDVPATRGYGREELKRTESAYSVMLDTRFTLADALALSLLVQSWKTDNQWLENQYKLQLDYDSNHWIKNSTFVVSLLHTEYNLESYNKEDKTDPDYLPILPWNKDTLLQAYIVIPWEF
mgnify:CR=1 FL=1